MATGNTVLKDGVVTIGNNPAQSANSMTGSVQNAGDEPGRVGSIHLHPTAGIMKVQKEVGAAIDGRTIYGGAPSGGPGNPRGDYEEHTRAYQAGEAKNGVRSIMVDEKNIDLYNSGSTNTIIIPRH